MIKSYFEITNVYCAFAAAKLEFTIQVSDYLDKNATGEQRNNGLDIANFFGNDKHN